MAIVHKTRVEGNIALAFTLAVAMEALILAPDTSTTVGVVGVVPKVADI